MLGLEHKERFTSVSNFHSKRNKFAIDSDSHLVKQVKNGWVSMLISQEATWLSELLHARCPTFSVTQSYSKCAFTGKTSVSLYHEDRKITIVVIEWFTVNRIENAAATVSMRKADIVSNFCRRFHMRSMRIVS